MALLVHGIADAQVGGDFDLSELDGSNVSFVAEEDLVAVVRELDGDDAVPSRANLLEHARLLELIGAQATIIPMRFGVVVDDTAHLRATLTADREFFRAELDRLAGTAEWRLRGSYDEEAVIREVLASDRRAAALQGAEGFEQRFELGERIARAIEARREADLAEVERAIGPHVRGVMPDEAAAPLDAFTLAVLVAESDADAFDRAIEEHGTRVAPALALELVGPMPPFSFVAREVGAWG